MATPPAHYNGDDGRALLWATYFCHLVMQWRASAHLPSPTQMCTQRYASSSTTPWRTTTEATSTHYPTVLPRSIKVSSRIDDDIITITSQRNVINATPSGRHCCKSIVGPTSLLPILLLPLVGPRSFPIHSTLVYDTAIPMVQTLLPPPPEPPSSMPTRPLKHLQNVRRPNGMYDKLYHTPAQNCPITRMRTKNSFACLSMGSVRTSKVRMRHVTYAIAVTRRFSSSMFLFIHIRFGLNRTIGARFEGN